MATFSIYDGTVKETIGYFLGGSYSIGSTYVDDILQSFQDNTSKLIFEKDIRNAVFSVASSQIFKETVAANSITPYIGIDTLNINATTSNVNLRDVKGKKILFGKRSFSGTFSYENTHDIFHIGSTYSILNSDTDIFFYNTKSDLIENNTTKLRLLAGTNRSIFQTAPLIQSQIIETGLFDSLSLDFINEGDIFVASDYGTISIHNPTNPSYSIKFPSISNSTGSASNNKILKWSENGLYWDYFKFPSTDYIGNTASKLNIFGSPVTVNDYPIEFTDLRKIPIQFNDVQSGQTFSNYQLNDLLRRMVYPYLKPTVSLKLLPPYQTGLVEVGSFPTPTVLIEVQKKSLNTGVGVLENMIPGNFPPIGSNTYITATGTSNGIVISPIADETTVFKISVSDGQSNVSATTSITGIYPYFYGFSDLLNMTNVGLGSLSKSIETKSDKTIDIVGTGSYYFIYDYDYGTLSNIYDNYGNTCSASFSSTNQILSSPTGLWAGKRFYIYKWLSATVSPPSKNFEFKY